MRSRITTEAVIGGITGPLTAPGVLLLGRYDVTGDLRLVARTTPLPTTARRELSTRLLPAEPAHPWHGRRFSAGWGTHGELNYQPIQPDLVAEFVADSAVDAGRYRHPVRYLRLRDDLSPQQAPPFSP